MKKDGAIVFQLNLNDQVIGRNDRLLAFYKQLVKKRHLSRFCREAFIEKVDRNLNGLEEHYNLLNSHIKSKGIEYILDAIREKETQSASVISEVEIEKAVNQIIQTVLTRIQNEPPFVPPMNIVNPITVPKNDPDMVKLMDLL